MISRRSALIALMALIFIFANGVGLGAANPKTITSPDRKLRAVITAAGPKGTESRVEIQTNDGKPLCVKDYSSEDGEHGLGVAESRWTPDSRFFVFSTSSSGGHQVALAHLLLQPLE